uniref:Uncharacterized protein n=1 Tax=Callorhinchus milii TaxID=7868 RepID=A0A4W3GE54_CALMI
MEITGSRDSSHPAPVNAVRHSIYSLGRVGYRKQRDGTQRQLSRGTLCSFSWSYTSSQPTHPLSPDRAQSGVPEPRIDLCYLISRLGGNRLTADCTEDLVSALITNNSLTKLGLNSNKLGDSGVKKLCEALRNPECKIQKLWLWVNSLTADCAEDLASALSTNHSLTELDLGDNKLGDSGVKQLCEALRNPQCKIQSLR